ncbi:helix-turn-helix transcriptional regulator [Leptospirillum ferriphilum]|uniref:DNA-binding protein n=1 Tax=Leptospirillum ferriphilum YSK TaxID=1441628 RepID=A0A059Y0V6_9BACT|nr:helix-turn-helix transcriptional regulator [Leptospirillum ferriphilum]AIA31102.1 DNA-binding protein [Leptospirillum ferriphilum YSK]
MKSKILPNWNINDGPIRIHSTDDLGAILKARRKKQKMTQSDLAALAGTGVRYIVDLENGKPTARIGPALKLIEWLGLEVTIQEKRIDQGAFRLH